MLNYLINENTKALKEGDTLTRVVLTGAIANIQRTAIDRGCRNNVTNELVTEVLRKEEKTLNEMINTCPTDRPELREQYEAKLEVLRKYVPELITDPDKIRQLITNTCNDIELTTPNKGKIMKTMSTEYKGQIDMKVVQKVVSELIEEKSNG